MPDARQEKDQHNITGALLLSINASQETRDWAQGIEVLGPRTIEAVAGSTEIFQTNT